VIQHFYHIWAEGAWASPAEEHDHALEEARFPVKPKLGVTGAVEDRYVVACWAKAHGWEIVAEADEGFEQLTVSAMRRWAMSGEEQAAVLYAHAKGARTDLNGVNAHWRREMTARVVGEWEVCVRLLERHDAVGCGWRNAAEYPDIIFTEGSGVFFGNFWWATRDYLRALPEPGLLNRYDAEGWVGLGHPDAVDMMPAWIHHFGPSGASIVAAH
jgi:hypothetical protein